LNAAWPLLFFGLHAPGWAFAEIVLLWFGIAASIVAFAWIEPWSGLLLMPYLTWVTLAAVLNFVIWQMNS
jgi:tryptophan-rich sensory protein